MATPGSRPWSSPATHCFRKRSIETIADRGLRLRRRDADVAVVRLRVRAGVVGIAQDLQRYHLAGFLAEGALEIVDQVAGVALPAPDPLIVGGDSNHFDARAAAARGDRIDRH